jgi:hypothetical protein
MSHHRCPAILAKCHPAHDPNKTAQRTAGDEMANDSNQKGYSVPQINVHPLAHDGRIGPATLAERAVPTEQQNDHCRIDTRWTGRAGAGACRRANPQALQRVGWA